MSEHFETPVKQIDQSLTGSTTQTVPTKQSILRESNQLNNQCKQKCTNHSQRSGEYFQTQLPWVKFCESCALNLALCGKKIQKCLSSPQIFNKVYLFNIMETIKKEINNFENSHVQYGKISEQVQSIRSDFVEVLAGLQKFIDECTAIKVQLQNSLNEQLSKQLKNMFQRQNMLYSQKYLLARDLAKMETSFKQIISSQTPQHLKSFTKRVEQQIKSGSQLLITENYSSKISNNITELKSLFRQKIYALTNNKNEILPKINLKEVDLNFPNSIQKNGTRTQIFHLQSNKDSGLVTPCQAFNSGRQTLAEISINQRRTSRGSLQLRARCNKSGGKSSRSKIEVNVRPESYRKENLVKKPIRQ